MFNVQEIKKDFPIFKYHPNLVFLDSAASSQRPRVVIDAVREYYESYNANIHRGIYAISEKATAAYEEARKKIASFVGVTPEETIFTRNATEAINLVAYTWGRKNLSDKDEILITQMEHHSNIVPWQLLQQVTSYKLQVTSINKGYALDMDDYKEKLSSGKVKLVAVTHMSNVLGTINPIKEIVKLAHEAGALVLVDGAQAVPHMQVNVKDLDADFYVFSGHKMCGPTGIGILYGKKVLLEEMPPFMGGGDMIKEVTFEKTTYNDVPYKFEAGTPDIAGAIGLGAATDYLERIGMDVVREHEKKLTSYALGKLSEIGGITIYGPNNSPQPPLTLRGGAKNILPLNVRGDECGLRGGVISFSLEGVHPHDMATVLDEHTIAIRAGHHCAMPLHMHLGLSATARISFYVYNSREDVDSLITALQKVKKIFT